MQAEIAAAHVTAPTWESTDWATIVAAYDALAPDTKERIAGLRAVHCHGVAREKYTHALDKSQSEALRKTVEHPVVRTHPKTGRKCLYVNPMATDGVEGMSDSEGTALLDTLYAQCTRPEFTYRHHWRKGDLLMWDNCSGLHIAIMDYALPQRRRMHRITIKGSAPF